MKEGGRQSGRDSTSFLEKLSFGGRTTCTACALYTVEVIQVGSPAIPGLKIFSAETMQNGVTPYCVVFVCL